MKRTLTKSRRMSWRCIFARNFVRVINDLVECLFLLELNTFERLLILYLWDLSLFMPLVIHSISIILSANSRIYHLSFFSSVDFST